MPAPVPPALLSVESLTKSFTSKPLFENLSFTIAEGDRIGYVPQDAVFASGILWLESLMKSEPEAFVAVSHDRYFLENVARRMLELNRTYASGLLQTDGNYSEFLEKRDELLRNEAAYQDTMPPSCRCPSAPGPGEGRVGHGMKG